MSSEQLRSAFKWSGVVLLVAGLAASVVVWRAQDQIEKERKAAQAADPSLPLAPLDSGKHVRDVEIYYGKLGVLMQKADDLLQGKSLAKTIAVVSTLTAASLFLLAGRRPA